ncbi:hydrolase [Streptomyces sp. NPDC059506]|uniref:hydrolase n=1 Tax=Streptomyces TaxID=1883 RepID=UPI0021753934|nr:MULTISPECIES: hydrolase [unclassified Streptomyces]MCZ2526337.1 hydrolase [Streptomyces sp. HB2AG]
MHPDTAPASPLTAAARAVVPLAAAHAAAADTDRSLHPDVVEAIVAAGFTRHFAPPGACGPPGTFADLLTAAAELGTGCPSAAWIASVCASAGRLTGLLPGAGREEVWAKGDGTVVAAGLIPAGTAVPVPGGWRLTGAWPYVSGSGFADWTLLAARTEAGGRTQVRVFAVPAADCTVRDTWRTLGMRGTGSNTVVAEAVTVPAERTVPLDTLVSGASFPGAAPCHTVPLKAANGLTLAAPLLGAARGAVRRWTELVGERLTAPPAGVSGAPDRSTYEQALARSEGETDAAALLLARVGRVADEGEVDEAATARNARDCALAAEYLTAAVDRLLRSAGTRAHAEGEELQRRWRDLVCGAGHAALQFAPAARAWSFSRDQAQPRTGAAGQASG